MSTPQGNSSVVVPPSGGTDTKKGTEPLTPRPAAVLDELPPCATLSIIYSHISGEPTRLTGDQWLSSKHSSDLEASWGTRVHYDKEKRKFRLRIDAASVCHAYVPMRATFFSQVGLHDASGVHWATRDDVACSVTKSNATSTTYSFDLGKKGYAWHIGITLLRKDLAPVTKILSQKAIDYANTYKSRLPLPGDACRIMHKDVAFIFPKDSRVLFAEKDTLCRASGYFTDLFQSGFVESGNLLVDTKPWQTALHEQIEQVRRAQDGEKKRDYQLDDSDNEDLPIDANSSDAGQAESTSFFPKDMRIQYVTVKDAPFRTFWALLHWISTAQVEFAPLRSAQVASRAAVERSACSPKSMYMLSHLYRIAELRQLALADFREQLNIDNVLQEMYTETCLTYSELEDAAFHCFQELWPELKKHKMLDAMEQLEALSTADPHRLMRLQRRIVKTVATFSK